MIMTQPMQFLSIPRVKSSLPVWPIEIRLDRTPPSPAMTQDRIYLLISAMHHFQRLSAQDGAASAPTGPTLGFTRDSEPDGQQSTYADGDGADEDGVSFSPIAMGLMATATISVNGIVGSTPTYLSGWIDFNGDGDFEDAGEKFFSVTVTSIGSYPASFAVPDSSGPLYARFRLSTQQNLGATGEAPDGEVEDYVLYPEVGNDYGDAPASYGTLTASNRARGPMLGATRDAEAAGQPSVLADGDGTDEDGVKQGTSANNAGFSTIDLASGFATFTVIVTDPLDASGNTVLANFIAWIDWEHDGIFSHDDGRDRLFVSNPVFMQDVTQTFTVPVPFYALPGPTYARFRISTDFSGNPTDPLMDGETEDYAVTIVAPPPPTVVSTNFEATGTLEPLAESVAVAFSASVAGASDFENVSLQRAGDDGLLGTFDDVAIFISGIHSDLESQNFNYLLNPDINGPLVEDIYRFTLKDSITGANGQQLDGNNDGIAGGDWVKDFVVVARNPANVELDPTFGLGGVVITSFRPGNDYAFDSVIQSDGKLVVVGTGGFQTDAEHIALTRYNADGTLDGTFGVEGKVTSTTSGRGESASSVAIQSDGKIVVAGNYYNSTNGRSDFLVLRYRSNGQLDLSFNNTGYVTTDFAGSDDYARDVKVQADGKIVVVGSRLANDGTVLHAIARFNMDGTLDAAFGLGGRVTTSSLDGEAYNVSLVDNSIIVSGYSYDPNSLNSFTTSFVLAKFNSDGTLDFSFGTSGKVTTTFGDSSYSTGMGIQSDGKIVLSGFVRIVGGYDHIALARYTTTGALDTSFDGDGRVTTSIGYVDYSSDLTIQADQKIVLAGSIDNYYANFALLRYNSDGSLDSSFGNAGHFTTPVGTSISRANSVSIQADGKIIAVGSAADGNNNNFALIRVTETASSYVLSSSNNFTFDVDAFGHGAGQILNGTNNSFDGLNRLQINAQDFLPPTSSMKLLGEPTVSISGFTYAGLSVSREVTVPESGAQDFARTIDSFTNTTAQTITTTVNILGNLGSDAATTVFATSNDVVDSPVSVDVADQWIGTDDADGSGSPAVIHYIHGPRYSQGQNGLEPTSVQVIGDNIQWTYSITVDPGQTLRLAHFTIVAATRQAAIAAANTLVTQTALGGQAASYLSDEEIASLANFAFFAPPSDLILDAFPLNSTPTISEHIPANSVVTTLSTVDVDLDTPASDSFTYELISGNGDTHNAAFAIVSNQLRLIASPDYQLQNLYALRVRTTDSHGLTFEKPILIRVLNIEEADFGDAPAPYPTTLAQNGARHEAVGPRLGATRDIDADGQPSAVAEGDGTDEDGVTFGVFTAGQLAGSVTVSVANAPTGAKLDAWIDFNHDGTWGGPGEQIFESKAVIAGDNRLTFTIPSYAIIGQTFARFRLSTAGDLGVGGFAPDGEVEDYVVTIQPPTSPDGSGTFLGSTSIPGAFSSVSTVYAADLDGDGDLDSLTASFGSGQIAWQANDGVGNFTSQGVIATIGGASSAIAADIDGDGRLDVIATSYSTNSVLWYKNTESNGVVTFIEQAAIDDQNAPLVSKAFAADMDGDGDIDLLSASVGVGTAGGVIKLYLNNGPGNALTPIVVRGGLNAAYDVTAADLDHDGDMDILAALTGSNTVVWYENAEAFGFPDDSSHTHIVSSQAIGAHRVLAVDMDLDGDIDIVSSSINDNRITWHENNGPGTTTIIHEIDTSVTGATGVRSIEVADLDGDGDVDVLASLFGDNSFVWFRNNGSQVYSRITIEASISGAHSAVAADLDGDGDLDVLAGSYFGNTVVWYENTSVDFGDAPLPYPTLSSENGAQHFARGPRLGDTRIGKSDGLHSSNADLDANDDGVSFGVLKVGQFHATVTVNVQNAPLGARLDAWIDFNGDGSWGGPGEQIFDSLLLVNGTQELEFNIPSSAVPGNRYTRFRISSAGDLGWLGSAFDGEVEDYRIPISPATSVDGTGFIGGDFTPIYSADPLARNVKIATADFNGDGTLDIVAADSKFGIYWNPNLPGTGFVIDGGNAIDNTNALNSSPASVSQIQAADVNGDSFVDVVAVDYYLGTVAYYKNDGWGNFGSKIIIAQGANADLLEYVNVADIDGDGDVDILVAAKGFYTFSPVMLYVNNGGLNPTFSPIAIRSEQEYAYDVTSSDIDSDGDLDILIATADSSSNSSVYWYENKGANRFESHALPISGARKVVAADLDADGKVDILVYSVDEGLIVFPNTGADNFLDFQAIDLFAHIESLEIADLDGDSDVDILTSGRFRPGAAVWYRNEGTADGVSHFESIFIARDVTRYVASTAGDFDGDGDLDVLAASEAAQVSWYENSAIDLGDAPFPYPTNIDGNGATHFVKGPKLGLLRDGETDGQPSVNASGDGADEDGISIGIISNGFDTSTINVTATNVAVGNTFVNGWIDFNQDGDWDDAGEHVLDSLPVIEGTNTFSISVPAAAISGTTFARLRIAEGLVATTPIGFAPNGEVEDYALTIYQGNLTVNLPSGNGADDVTLRLNGLNLEVYDNRNNTLILSQLFSVTSGIAFNGANTEADRLTVDYAFGGYFALPHGVQFSGGTGVGDELVVNGTGTTFFGYVSTGGSLGNASIQASDWTGNDTISFSGVESLSILNALDVNIVGALNVGANNLTIDSVGYTTLGQTTTLTGGTITAAGGLVLGTGQVLQARGTIAAPIYSERGSTIQATGALALGDENALDGIDIQGRLIVGAFSVTLNDAHNAVLGSQTTIGSATANGNLIAPGGITLDANQALSGRGTISTPGGAFENQGFVQGNATGLTFHHMVTGAGSFGGNVIFDGGTSFGNSPTHTRINGNALFTTNNTAIVEIGGLSPGSGFDNVTATGSISLAGNLDVRLISLGSAYTPKIGDSFELYSAAAITGNFANVTYAALPAGMAWRLKYTAAAVTITVVPQFAPTVLSAEINGDSSQRQRSIVQSIQLTFSSVVNIQPGAIDVRLIGGVSDNGGTPASFNELIPLRILEISIVDGHTVVIVGFADSSGNPLKTLDDGKYQLRIDANSVTDSLNDMSLDGDADGVMGGTYTYREVDNLSLQSVDNFFRLFGDQDGDRDVDNLDLLKFRSSLNKSTGQNGYLWYFDFDSNGTVDSSDLTEFNLRKKLTIRR